MLDEKDLLIDIYDALLVDIITFKNAKTRMKQHHQKLIGVS